MSVDEQTKKRVDKWIADNRLNPYGDKNGTVYTGGTPLFNEVTGATTDKYDYILRRHPELRNGK